MAIPLILLVIFWQCRSASSSARLRWDLTDDKVNRIKFGREDYAVTLHSGNTVYIGGTNVVHKINIVNSSENKIPVIDQWSIDDCNKSKEEYCQNTITVLQTLDENKILVCGTNAERPKCWHLGNDGNLTVVINGFNAPLGIGVSGFIPKQRTTSLYVDRRLYSAAPLYRNGEGIVFQGYRNKKRVQTQDNWMREPVFTNMAALDDLIFMFFREKREKDEDVENLEVDPWISRIARACKADMGGPKSDLHNKWTTFLKARLVCSLPSQNLYFNRVEDVFIDKSDMYSEIRVYGVFSNRWNSTAVCIYSMKDILNVFKKSTFKDFDGKIPNHRPGMCVADSQSIPRETLDFMKEHAEMEQLIHPIGGKPIHSSKQHYFTKIVVDRFVGNGDVIAHVLFLATGNGKIQKVLETSETTFVISELTVLSEPGPILSMFLDSQTISGKRAQNQPLKHLYINSAEELVRYPLSQCFRHGTTCENCVMARDPYCGWNQWNRKCETFNRRDKLIQDLQSGNHRICSESEAMFSYSHHGPALGKETQQITISNDTESLPMYLPCRKFSHHAEYSWKHNNQTLSCFSTHDDCLLLIERFSEANYGLYKCTSREDGMEQVHASFSIGAPLFLDSSGCSFALFSPLLLAVTLLLH